MFEEKLNTLSQMMAEHMTISLLCGLLKGADGHRVILAVRSGWAAVT